MSTNAEQTSEGIDNLRKNRDELATQLAELTAKHRALQADVAFKEANLDPKHGQLFLKVHGEGEDITADAVKAFAAEYNLQPAAPPAAEPSPATGSPNQAEGTVVKPNADPAALQAMGGAGQGPAGVNPPSSPGQKMSVSQFESLLKTDRAAALAAYTEGRVQHAEGNVFVDQAKRAGVLE